MNEEMSFFGVFVPSILVCSILSYAAVVVIARIMRATDAYRFVWHKSLFNFAMFVCILCVTVLLFSQART
ncbi:MAG: DUF1656 domain-containing protein [Hyphomicrobium sp.]|uniref:DUF1656 domain-containing protein n=1 Tax=Hyphomicrobium sp. TaxID=82 RepID=UPI0039E39C72